MVKLPTLRATSAVLDGSREMLESKIEEYVKKTLEGWGFRVLKFVAPGYAGVMDRMIVFPLYSPRAPEFVELKRPDGKLSTVQRHVALDFAKRGMIIHAPVWTMDQATDFCAMMIDQVRHDYNAAKGINA